MTATAIINIGKLVSGDCRKGLLDADTVLIHDGLGVKVVTEIGAAEQKGREKCGLVA